MFEFPLHCFYDVFTDDLRRGFEGNQTIINENNYSNLLKWGSEWDIWWWSTVEIFRSYFRLLLHRWKFKFNSFRFVLLEGFSKRKRFREALFCTQPLTRYLIYCFKHTRISFSFRSDVRIIRRLTTVKNEKI